MATNAQSSVSSGAAVAGTASPPRRPWLVVGLSAFAGFLLTVVWSAEFVDRTIGGGVVDAFLGIDPETAAAGVGVSVAFAFVSGLAGTFTACNVAVFGAMAPIAGSGGTGTGRLRRLLRPLGALSAGMISVSAAYGVIVALVGTGMPQFQTATVVDGLAPRIVQAMIVYGVIGAAMLYFGLAAAGLVPDVMARLARWRPGAPFFVLGALVGAFLIGRPFPLFRAMFRGAAESGNVFYGAAAFVLQSVGNILLMVVVLVVLVLTVGDRVSRWFAADPRRVAVLTTAGFVTAGAFLVLYWDVRILERREIIPWYPTAPWV